MAGSLLHVTIGQTGGVLGVKIDPQSERGWLALVNSAVRLIFAKLSIVEQMPYIYAFCTNFHGAIVRFPPLKEVWSPN